jgi:hypothetical protein
MIKTRSTEAQIVGVLRGADARAGRVEGEADINT